MNPLRLATRSCLAATLLLLALTASPARADQEGDFVYAITGATAVLTGYVGPGGAVIIPDRLGNLPLTSIGWGAFYRAGLTSVTIPSSVTSIGIGAFLGCTGLTGVTIPNSVTDIGIEAFSECTGLTSLTIPDSVASIGRRAFFSCTSLRAIEVASLNLAYRSTEGVLFNKAQSVLITYPAGKSGPYAIPTSVTTIRDYAFYDCTGLTSVTIPVSVTSIGEVAFSGCTGLTSVTIPSSVTSIGDSTFSRCTGLTSVSIPSSVTSIGYSAFSGCTGLTSVAIPNSVTTIRDYAFSACTGLTSVTIPGRVTSIGRAAFANCTGLTSVTIANGVTSIGDSAFSGCTGLASVTIPNSVASIGSSAFSDCKSLTGVTIPNSVTNIGGQAFYGCTSLTSVTIPNSVTSIGGSAFSGCTGVRAIEVDSLNLSYRSTDGVLFNKAQSVLIAYPAGQSGPYTIPNSVTSIEGSAFSRCTGLTSVTIPSSVAAIGWEAFSGCTGLTSIAIPNSVAAIGPWTFSGCTGLASVTIPNSVTSIEGSAFSRCTGLTSVTIPDSVTSIEDRAFYGCAGLTSVTIPSSVTYIGDWAFSGCAGLKAIEVDSLNLAYRSAAGVLYDKAQSVLIAYPARQAGPYTIPSSVTSIEDWAFYGCTGLTSVRIPESVTSIGEWAFSECMGLASVYFEGAAPSFVRDRVEEQGPFSGSAFVTVFYRAGTEGWGPVFADRPTAVWAPPPAYGDWAVSTGLASQFPNASAEDDDPDGDDFPNGAEWTAATDPTQADSRLELDPIPRPADLAPSDQTPIDPAQHPLYFRTVPGKYYAIQRAPALGAPWQLQATRIAATTQTRILLPKPEPHAFYRVLALP